MGVIIIICIICAGVGFCLGGPAGAIIGLIIGFLLISKMNSK